MDEIKLTRSTTVTHAFDMSNWYMPSRSKLMRCDFQIPEFDWTQEPPQITQLRSIAPTCGFPDPSKIQPTYVFPILQSLSQVSNSCRDSSKDIRIPKIQTRPTEGRKECLQVCLVGYSRVRCLQSKLVILIQMGNRSVTMASSSFPLLPSTRTRPGEPREPLRTFQSLFIRWSLHRSLVSRRGEPQLNRTSPSPSTVSF